MEASSQWRAWLGVGLALVLSLGAALWLRSDRTSDTANPGADVSKGPARPDAALAEAAAESEAATGAAERASLAPAPVPAEGAEDDRSANADEFRIEVVDAATDVPVEGATLLYLDLGPNASPSDREAITSTALIDAVLARGTPLERSTDELGAASVPRPTGPAVAVARKAERFGFVPLTDTVPERMRLPIAPDWPLVVQVVDRTGRGVSGVPVALRERYGEGTAHNAIAARTSGTEGIATLAHAGAYIGRKTNKRTWSAGAACALRTPVEVELNPFAPPREPVILVLPETGRVVVEVLDVGGQPFLEPSSVRLESIDHASAGGNPVPPASAPLEVGKAVFEHVEIGSLLVAWTSRPHSGPGDIEIRAPGPSRAGETTAITLRFGLDRPVLEARVVSADGEPVARQELQAALRSPSSLRSFSVQTAADGRFRLDLAPELAVIPDLSLALTDRASRRTSRGVAIPAGLAPGLHPVGDIVLDEAPLIAAGTVVDRAGAPIARAQVQGYTATDQDRPGLHKILWRDIANEGTRTRLDGRFELRGSVATDRPVLVSARRDGFSPANVQCPLGTSGIELVLDASGSIVGRLVAGDDVPFEQLILQADDPSQPPENGAWLMRYGNRRNVSASGRFALTDLPAGVYSLAVRTWFAEEPLLVLSGLVVESGATCSDPRLREVDLSALAGGSTLRIVDRQGRRVPQGKVLVRPSDGGMSRPESFANGECRVLRPAGAIDVEVHAAGFRAASATGITGDREIALDPGIRVRLVLTNPSALPAPPFFVAAALDMVDDEVKGALGGVDAEFDARGELAYVATTAGRAKVVWSLIFRSSVSGGSSFIEPETPHFVEVADLGGEQTFELTLDEKALAEAMGLLKD